MTIAIDANNPTRSVSVSQDGEKVYVSISGIDTFAVVTLDRVEWDALVAGAA
jgi:hypothetical protein